MQDIIPAGGLLFVVQAGTLAEASGSCQAVMKLRNILQSSASALAAPDHSPAVAAIAMQPADGEQAGLNSTAVAQVKYEAFDALNTAFCEHIYGVALQLLNQQYNEDVLAKQFVDISDRDDPFDRSCSIASQSENSGKNRYRDVIPYDHNRVLLPPVQLESSSTSDAATTSRHSSSGSHVLNSNSSHHSSTDDATYINASYMGDPHSVDQSSNPVFDYIATQGPLPNTVADFWRMAVATNSSAIVMLTGLTDGSPILGSSRPRCAAYFPDQEQDCLCIPGGITVTCVHKSDLDENVFFRQLEVVWSSSPNQQHLWINHYQYSAWPDFGVPGITHSVLTLCHALDSCRRPRCKIIVHCSAGVGRTGTFIGTTCNTACLIEHSVEMHAFICCIARSQSCEQAHTAAHCGPCSNIYILQLFRVSDPGPPYGSHLCTISTSISLASLHHSLL